MSEFTRQNIFKVIIVICGFFILGQQASLATEMAGKVTAVSGEKITIRLNEGWIPNKGDKVTLSRDHPMLGIISVGEAIIVRVDTAPLVMAKKSAGEAEITIGTDAVVSSKSTKRVEIKAEVILHPDPIRKKPDEALIAAAKKGDMIAVRNALKAGANINAASEGGYDTALMSASYKGNLELVRLLLQSGANPNLVSVFSGQNALIMAARTGQIKIAELLLDAGVDINFSTSSQTKDFYSRSTAIAHAAAWKHTDMVTFLISRGADPNLENKMGFSAIFMAAHGGNIDTLNALLNAGVLLDQMSSTGVTPLMITTGTDWKLTAYFLDAGADPDQRAEEASSIFKSDAPGMTALMFSILAREPETFYTLILGGAKTDIKRQDGKTALDLVVELLKKGKPDTESYKQMEIIQRSLLHPDWGRKNAMAVVAEKLEDEVEDNNFVLVSAVMRLGINPNILVDGNPLFFAAIDTGNIAMINLFLEHGADPNVKDEDGFTAFYRALFKRNTAVTRRMIARGADPNILPTDIDETPLHGAAESGFIVEVKLMLEAGMQVDVRDKGQETPLHKAANKGQLEIFTILLKAGANPALKNEDGDTPIDLVSKSKKPAFQESLRTAQ